MCKKCEEENDKLRVTLDGVIEERLNKLKSEISKDANSKIEAINEEIKRIKL